VAVKKDALIDAIRASYLANITKQNTQPKIDIALSGGCDSMVLMYALNQLKDELKLSIKAHYIHHGLSAYADEWLAFCEAACKKLNIPFDSMRVDTNTLPSLGIEGFARKLRYEALAQLSVGVIATAHHENDQAETLLLQLIRGAGLKGLAAMPEYDKEKNLWRPLLRVQRQVIEDFAEIHEIVFIEDDSNEDTRFDRNFLRKNILPQLYERFPHAANTIARSAKLIASGLDLHQSIAESDSESYFSKDLARLNLMMMRDLNQERVINLIRWWLEKHRYKMPTLKVMQEAYKQIKDRRKDAQINIQIAPNVSIRAYKNELWLVENVTNAADFEIYWRGEDTITLPDASKLSFTKTIGDGISVDKLGTQTIRIQNRRGGERFKPAANQPTRTLKHLLQQSPLAPWEREILPMLFLEDQLIAVPHFGVHCDFQAKKYEESYQISWLRDI